MKTKHKTKWLGLLALAMAVGVGTAKADPNSANNTGTFVVRVTPNVDLAVTVDTTNSGWQSNPGSLDTTLALNAEDILLTGVKLTIGGDFNNQELQLSAAANNTWQLDTANITPATDQVNLFAMVGADQATPPTTGLFVAAVTNLLTGTPTQAGQSQANESSPGTSPTYEFAPADGSVYADVDGMTISTARRLWLKLVTGTATSTDQQQGFTVTVTAVSGAGS